MSESNKTYTYRGGQKVELEKSPDQMVVRAERNRAITFPSIVATYSRKFGKNIAGQASTRD